MVGLLVLLVVVCALHVVGVGHDHHEAEGVGLVDALTGLGLFMAAAAAIVMRQRVCRVVRSNACLFSLPPPISAAALAFRPPKEAPLRC
jgi:uncharacterized membrane protein